MQNIMQKDQNIHFTPGWKNSVFSPRGKVRVSQKKIHPGLKFHAKVNFTSPMCNITLRFGLEKRLDYLTKVRLILRYIGLRLP